MLSATQWGHSCLDTTDSKITNSKNSNELLLQHGSSGDLAGKLNTLESIMENIAF